MFDFKRVTLADIPLITDITSQGERYRYSDTVPCDVFMWADFYDASFCVENGAFYYRQNRFPDMQYFAMPLTSKDVGEALDALLGFCRGEGKPMRIVCPVEGAAVLRERYPQSVTTRLDGYYDYLYEANDILTLSGKKYHQKRNHIAAFERSFPDWSYEPITESNLDAVKDFFKGMLLSGDACDENEKTYESCKVKTVLDNYLSLPVVGGVLTGGGAIKGFAVGSICGDTLYDHIEKAVREDAGAYAMLFYQFVKHNASDVRYINREDDAENAGLKAAKEAWHPTALLYRYLTEVK